MCCAVPLEPRTQRQSGSLVSEELYAVLYAIWHGSDLGAAVMLPLRGAGQLQPPRVAVDRRPQFPAARTSP